MKKINCTLLIDDNPGDNVYHKIIIEEAGICNNIKVATDGIKGLEYLENSAKPEKQTDYPKPDLILLDINMPRMNGFEFLEKYQKLDEKIKSNTVIGMLTTSLDPHDHEKAKIYKCVVDYFQKPLTTELVKETVEKYF